MNLLACLHRQPVLRLYGIAGMGLAIALLLRPRVVASFETIPYRVNMVCSHEYLGILGDEEPTARALLVCRTIQVYYRMQENCLRLVTDSHSQCSEDNYMVVLKSHH